MGTFTPCGFCPAGEDDLQDGRTRLIERRRLIGTAALPRRKAQPAQDGRWGCVGESFGKEGLACWVFQACEIYWLWLSRNPNDRALALLEGNPDNIDWYMLSRNPNDRALALLEQNPEEIHWARLSRNPNDRALALLERNLEDISWWQLSRNPNDRAIDLLMKGSGRRNWDFSKKKE